MASITANVAVRAVAPAGVAPSKRSRGGVAVAPAAAGPARKAAFMGSSADSAALRAQPLRTSVPRGRALVAYASGSNTVVVAAAAPAPKGADMKALSYSVLAGVVIWLLPAPVGVTLKAWHLLAHFVATSVGIITSVRPPTRRHETPVGGATPTGSDRRPWRPRRARAAKCAAARARQRVFAARCAAAAAGGGPARCAVAC